jgi:HNH endonuclease
MAEPMRTRLQQRAQHACEYCRLPQRASLLPHQIDHIIAQQHMGSNEENNLCLCCLRCNLKKGPNIASTDPEAGHAYRIVALFHPRKQRWHAHFQLQEDGRIEGVTPVGRATVRLLDFNAEERVQLRRLLMRQGWRP